MSVRVDGNQYEGRGSFTVTGVSLKRTGVAGQDFVHGYIEEPIVPQIKGEWSIGHQLSIVALEAITNSTAQLALANSMTYVLTNCWTTSAFVVDAHDGKVEVTLEGLTLEEIAGTSS